MAVCERRHHHVLCASNRVSPFLRELPLLVIRSKKAVLDQLTAVGVRRERERAEVVRNELICAATTRLLAVKKEQLLKVELLDTTAKRVQELEEATLPIEKRGRAPRCGTRA